MFGLFTTPEKQMRENAQNWLDVAQRVYNYRRDELTDAELTDLRQKTETLRAQVREKADAGKLKLSIEALEPVLRASGGRIYPHSGLREWVEFFVVAAILLIGSRQFFFQPFKIPTNSMWPTYNGMVPEVHATPADEPGATSIAFRKVALGATTYRVDAPTEGEIVVPVINPDTKRPQLISDPSKGRQWFIFPQAEQKYYFYVGSDPITVSVPEDFNMGWVIKDTFAPDYVDFSAMIKDWNKTKKYIDRQIPTANGDQLLVRYFFTGKKVKAGDRALSFDIITGDQLFVDRLSYHFVRPNVGSGFVFRTTNIHGTTGRDGRHVDSYYIKRLGGVPGDKLEVRNGVLYRNGAPITGAQAFSDNNARAGQYRGYENYGLLREGKIYTVSENGYIALGDNSYDSQDSRYWGEVPKKDAVGRPLWVFYPFGKHWGPAK